MIPLGDTAFSTNCLPLIFPGTWGFSSNTFFSTILFESKLPLLTLPHLLSTIVFPQDSVLSTTLFLLAINSPPTWCQILPLCRWFCHICFKLSSSLSTSSPPVCHNSCLILGHWARLSLFSHQILLHLLSLPWYLPPFSSSLLYPSRIPYLWQVSRPHLWHYSHLETTYSHYQRNCSLMPLPTSCLPPHALGCWLQDTTTVTHCYGPSHPWLWLPCVFFCLHFSP